MAAARPRPLHRPSPASTTTDATAATTAHFALPISRHLLPVLSYAGLASVTAGAFHLVQPVLAGQGVAIVGGCVVVPAAFVLAQLLLTGGAGVAKRMGGVPADATLTALAHDAAAAVGVPPPRQHGAKCLACSHGLTILLRATLPTLRRRLKQRSSTCPKSPLTTQAPPRLRDREARAERLRSLRPLWRLADNRGGDEWAAGRTDQARAAGSLAHTHSSVSTAACASSTLHAVLAHEMGHLRHHDVARNMHVAVAAAGLGGIYQAGRLLFDTSLRPTRPRKKESKDDKDKGEGVGGAGLGLVLMAGGLGAQAVAHLAQLAASRGSELQARAL
eukprot:scaffold59617_cov79-Phaeocystis_antarctica.AAC.14